MIIDFISLIYFFHNKSIKISKYYNLIFLIWTVMGYTCFLMIKERCGEWTWFSQGQAWHTIRANTQVRPYNKSRCRSLVLVLISLFALLSFLRKQESSFCFSNRQLTTSNQQSPTSNVVINRNYYFPNFPISSPYPTILPCIAFKTEFLSDFWGSRVSILLIA